MSSFRDDEASGEESLPREGVEIICGLVVYRVALGTRNLVIGGRTYTAQPAGRGEAGVSASSDPRTVVVTLPMSHPVCRRYMAGGVPPRLVTMTVYRQQGRSGLTEQLWSGYVTSMAPEKHVGRFNVPSRSSEAMQRRIPTITGGKLCPHILFDANCKIDRTITGVYRILTTVTVISGRVVTVADVDGDLGPVADDWATFGEFIHTASGERMTIQSQVGRVITMQLPIFELAIGDAVEISAGCSHNISVCVGKFNNAVNFGGFPDHQVVNIFPKGGSRGGSPHGMGPSNPKQEQ